MAAAGDNVRSFWDIVEKLDDGHKKTGDLALLSDVLVRCSVQKNARRSSARHTGQVQGQGALGTAADVAWDNTNSRAAPGSGTDGLARSYSTSGAGKAAQPACPASPSQHRSTAVKQPASMLPRPSQVAAVQRLPSLVQSHPASPQQPGPGYKPYPLPGGDMSAQPFAHDPPERDLDAPGLSNLGVPGCDPGTPKCDLSDPGYDLGAPGEPDSAPASALEPVVEGVLLGTAERTLVQGMAPGPPAAAPAAAASPTASDHALIAAGGGDAGGGSDGGGVESGSMSVDGVAQEGPPTPAAAAAQPISQQPSHNNRPHGSAQARPVSALHPSHHPSRSPLPTPPSPTGPHPPLTPPSLLMPQCAPAAAEGAAPPLSIVPPLPLPLAQLLQHQGSQRQPRAPLALSPSSPSWTSVADQGQGQDLGQRRREGAAGSRVASTSSPWPDLGAASPASTPLAPSSAAPSPSPSPSSAPLPSPWTTGFCLQQQQQRQHPLLPRQWVRVNEAGRGVKARGIGGMGGLPGGPGGNEGEHRQAAAPSPQPLAKTPQTRYAEVVRRVQRLRSYQPPSASLARPSPLATWAAGWSSALQGAPTAELGIAPGPPGCPPPASAQAPAPPPGPPSPPGSPGVVDDPSALTQEQQQVAAVGHCLELLDSFTMAAAAHRPPSLMEQVQASREGGGPHRALPPPPPPPAFPSSAAWDYLVAAQGSLQGLVKLEEGVQHMRQKMKVVVERCGMDRGLATSPALAPIEASLALGELAALHCSLPPTPRTPRTPPSPRSHRHLAASHSCSGSQPAIPRTPPGTPPTPSSSTPLRAPNPSLGAPGHTSHAPGHTCDSSHTMSESMLARPPTAQPPGFNPEISSSSSSSPRPRPCPPPHALPARPALVFSLSLPQLSSPGPPSPPPSALHPSLSPRRQIPEQPPPAAASPAAHSPAPAPASAPAPPYIERRPSPLNPQQGNRGTFSPVPRSAPPSPSPSPSPFPPPSPSPGPTPSHGTSAGSCPNLRLASPATLHSGCGQEELLGGGWLQCDREVQGSNPGLVQNNGTVSADVACTNELWQWLENLMVHMHASEASRLQLGSPPAAPPLLPLAANPHSPGAVGSVPNLLNLLHRARLRGAAGPSNSSEPNNGAKASVPYVEQNALRAATASSFEPEHLLRLLYFMLQLAISTGRLPPGDAGFLLTASLELLVGEVHWLLALLRAMQGPGSPHLRALHAALRAYDHQADYSAQLLQHINSLRAELKDALGRARHAEEQVRQQETSSQAGSSKADSLHFKLVQVQAENVELQAKVASLEARVQYYETDLEHLEQEHDRREAVLQAAARFRDNSNVWMRQTEEQLSKAVQVASGGSCADPSAVPPEPAEADPEPRSRRQRRSASGSGRLATQRSGSSTSRESLHNVAAGRRLAITRTKSRLAKG